MSSNHSDLYASYPSCLRELASGKWFYSKCVFSLARTGLLCLASFEAKDLKWICYYGNHPEISQ